MKLVVIQYSARIRNNLYCFSIYNANCKGYKIIWLTYNEFKFCNWPSSVEITPESRLKDKSLQEKQRSQVKKYGFEV